MALFFAGFDFALAAMNVYLGLTRGNALAWPGVVFCFGMGIIQTAIYLKEGR